MQPPMQPPMQRRCADTKADANADADAAVDAVAEATDETAADDRSEEATAEKRNYIFDETETKLLLDPDKTFPHTPFVEMLAGAATGDKVEFQFTFGDDYDDEELRGREAYFSLEILDVNRRELPPLDDELAQLEGQFETLAELKTSVRENLEAAARSEAEAELFEAFIEELLATAQISYPPLMVEQEAEAFKDGIKKELDSVKISWDKYLEMVQEDEATLETRWLTEAESRLQRHLVLRELITNEKLTVNENDLIELLQGQLAKYQDPEIRQYILSMYLEGNRGRELRNEALAKKAQERVVAILTGQAPDLDALDEEE
jgi:trigger factor